jgi:hypothetical protein
MRLIKCYLESERGIKMGFLEAEKKQFFFSPETGIIYKWQARKPLPNEKILHENTLEAFHISEIRGSEVNVAFFPGKQETIWVEDLFEKTLRELYEKPTAAVVDDCQGEGEIPPAYDADGVDHSVPHPVDHSNEVEKTEVAQVTHSEDQPNGAPDVDQAVIRSQKNSQI